MANKQKTFFSLSIEDTPQERTIKQGDIFEDVSFCYQIENNEEAGETLLIELTFPYAVVVTQSCDLERCKEVIDGSQGNHSKFLLSVIMLPIFNLNDVCKDNNYFAKETFKEDEPLIKMNIANVTSGSYSSDSYRFFSFYNDKLFGKNLIDFSQYFCVNYKTLLSMRESKRVGTLVFDESQKIVNMFVSYFARVPTESNKVNEDGTSINL